MKCSLSRTKFYKGPRFQRGFTFAEVLAAMIFMAILLPVVMQGLVLANRASVIAERKRTAVHLGNSLLTELVATEQWSYAGNRGNFGPGNELYEWELLQTGWNLDDMEQLTLIVTYPVQGQVHRINLTTLVEDDSL
jgi:type II secretory pathway pseudopilin PulG